MRQRNLRQLLGAEFLAEPFAGEVVWAYRPDVAFTPEPCDLENARRFADG